MIKTLIFLTLTLCYFFRKGHLTGFYLPSKYDEIGSIVTLRLTNKEIWGAFKNYAHSIVLETVVRQAYARRKMFFFQITIGLARSTSNFFISFSRRRTPTPWSTSQSRGTTRQLTNEWESLFAVGSLH